MKKIGLSVYGLSISGGGSNKQNLNRIVGDKGIIQILSEYIVEHIDE